MAEKEMEPAAVSLQSQVEALTLEGPALQCGFCSRGEENLEKAPHHLESQESANGLVLKQSMSGREKIRESVRLLLSVHTSPQNISSHQGNLERGEKKQEKKTRQTWHGLTGTITVIVEGSENISAGPWGARSKVKGNGDCICGTLRSWRRVRVQHSDAWGWSRAEALPSSWNSKQQRSQLQAQLTAPALHSPQYSQHRWPGIWARSLYSPAPFQTWTAAGMNTFMLSKREGAPPPFCCQFLAAPCAQAASLLPVHSSRCSALLWTLQHTQLIRENILSSNLNDFGIFRRAHVIFKLLPLCAALSCLAHLPRWICSLWNALISHTSHVKYNFGAKLVIIRNISLMLKTLKNLARRDE